MSLRQACKERLKVAFDSIRANSSSMTFILVVDAAGLKMISSTIKMMELINYGISIVERLDLKRKKITKMEAVYLISPESHDQLLRDYPQNGQPQYKTVHVLTLSSIPHDVMNKLAENINFSRRVRTLKELNISFTLNSQNQVLLCPHEQNSFESSLQPYSTLTEDTISELTTILSALPSFYIVQIFYLKGQVSNLAEKVALGLKERFEAMFRVYQKQGVPNYNSSAPTTTFLILDRSFDPVSPLIRDYHYGPFLYDVKNIQKHRVTVGKGKEKKELALDAGDQIMKKYKNKHISAALKGIPQDCQHFTASHSGAKFEKKQGEGELHLNELGEVLKKLPQYMDIKDRFSFHYEALEDILEAMERKQLKDQGFLEQAIITMQSEEGKKLKQKELFPDLMQRVEMTKVEEEKAKLVLIGLLCLQLKAKQAEALLQMLEGTSYHSVAAGLKLLAGTKKVRLTSKKTKGNQILNRHTPRIEELARDVCSQRYGQLKHLRVGAQKTSKLASKRQDYSGMRKIQRQTQAKQLPRLIVFINSALGYNQMRALSELEESHQVIYASHNFVTQNQYVQLLGRVSGEEEEL